MVGRTSPVRIVVITIRIGRRSLVPTAMLHGMLWITPKDDADSDASLHQSGIEQTGPLRP